jgi:hypothetical protein
MTTSHEQAIARLMGEDLKVWNAKPRFGDGRIYGTADGSIYGRYDDGSGYGGGYGYGCGYCYGDGAGASRDL